jgi:glycine/D-amino acid oxidase-like deaminating enzyme
VVVGAGVFGASLARHCALAGWDVVLIERVAPGHVRAGSGDESRLIRSCHGPDAWHTRSARRAWALWHEIDPALVVESGVAWLARRDDGWEAAGEAVLRAEGIPCERVDAADLFPSIALDDVRFTLFEPEAGILRARDAVKALAAQAVAAGAELVLAEARPDGAAVLLDDGRRLEADRVVWACGAWLAPLFPGVLALRITHQDVFCFGRAAVWRTPASGLVDYDGAAYGLATSTGAGESLNGRRRWPAVRSRDARARRCPRARAPDARLSGPSLPRARRGAPLVGHRACQYEITPDMHFLRWRCHTPTTTAACGCWRGLGPWLATWPRPWPSASSRG